MLKAIVCGGRNWRGRAAVWRVLSQIQPTSVIEGGCPTGADKYAREWARDHSVGLLTVPAEWDKYGKAAGPLRNKRMLAEAPDVVIAFPGGRGTADMVRQARAAGVRVIEPVGTGDSRE